MLTQAMVQRIPFPNEKNFKFLSSREGSDHTLFSTSSVVYTLRLVSVEQQVKKTFKSLIQIERMLSLRRVDEAIQLLEFEVEGEKKEVREEVTNDFSKINKSETFRIA